MQIAPSSLYQIEPYTGDKFSSLKLVRLRGAVAVALSVRRPMRYAKCTTNGIFIGQMQTGRYIFLPYQISEHAFGKLSKWVLTCRYKNSQNERN